MDDSRSHACGVLGVSIRYIENKEVYGLESKRARVASSMDVSHLWGPDVRLPGFVQEGQQDGDMLPLW